MSKSSKHQGKGKQQSVTTKPPLLLSELAGTVSRSDEDHSSSGGSGSVSSSGSSEQEEAQSQAGHGHGHGGESDTSPDKEGGLEEEEEEDGFIGDMQDLRGRGDVEQHVLCAQGMFCVACAVCCVVCGASRCIL